MAEILLTRNQITLIDDDKYKELNQYKWQASCKNGVFYATRKIILNSKEVEEKMHRRLLSAPPHLYVDHINGDTLDNRLENLRLATNRENQQNCHKQHSSRYPGVSLNGNNWAARIMVDKKTRCLGSYVVERDAFLAYLNACISLGFPIDFMVNKFNVTEDEMNRPVKKIIRYRRDYPLEYVDLAIRNGLSRGAFRHRVNAGWDLEKAATTPSKRASSSKTHIERNEHYG